MCDPFQLLANCQIDSRMIMPVNICPDRRVPVDVFATTAVAQERAVPLDNHDWCMLRRAPFRHVSEGVPNKLFVCGNQFFGVPVGHPFGALNSYLVQRNIELGNAWPACRGAHAPSRAGAGASPARTFQSAVRQTRRYGNVLISYASSSRRGACASRILANKSFS